MIRPFIYAVCDQGYFDLYGQAFLNSARAHGHEVELFCDHKQAVTDADKASYLVWRCKLLPELVEKHKAVLMLDADSVIMRPVEIEDEYDLGIFFRLHKKELHLKTLGTPLYCTERALPFARECARCISLGWYRDQVMLLALYHKMGRAYRVKHFDRSFASWKSATEAPIYTGKGLRKNRSPEFAAAVNIWKADAYL